VKAVHCLLVAFGKALFSIRLAKFLAGRLGNFTRVLYLTIPDTRSVDIATQNNTR